MRPRIRVITPLILLNAATFGVAPLRSGDAPRVALGGAGVEWSPSVIHDVGEPVWGLAAGQLDPATGAHEIAVLTQSAAVYALATADWTATPIMQGPTPIVPSFGHPVIEIADVVPGVPGDEVVACADWSVLVGMRDAAGAWSSETAYEQDFGFIWGARLHDVDPDRPGVEIVVSWEGFFDHGFVSVLAEEAGVWTQRIIFKAEVGMDTAWGDANPWAPGPELVFGTEMGPVYVLDPPTPIPPDEVNFWVASELVDDFDRAPWVTKIGDADRFAPGNELVVGTRYGPGIWIARPTAPGKPADIEVVLPRVFVSALSMSDLAIADVLPVPGNEIVGADGLGRVHVYWRTRRGWSGGVVWADPTGLPLRALVVTDADPGAPGQEIVVAGDSGRVIVLRR